MTSRRALPLAFAVAALAASACASATGGKRFEFQARAGGVIPDGVRTDAGFVFTNANGWTITLDRASVTLGPVYLNVVAPLRQETTGLLGLFVKNAWAHGEGHLGSGRVVGEVLGQVTFDALSPEPVAFPTSGSVTQEDIRSAEIWFYPRPGVSPETTKIDTVALDVRGTAERDGTTVPFRGSLVLDDTWQPEQAAGTRGTQAITDIRQVRGVPAAFYPVEGGTLDVRIDVTRLFRGADFGNLAANPKDPDGTTRLVQSKTGSVTTDQVMTNLYQGLRATGSYTVRWQLP